MLRIDINLLFTIVNLLVLYFLMQRFLFKPVREILEKRRLQIEEEYQTAEKVKAEAEAMKAEYEASVAGIAEERRQQLETSRIEAAKEYDTIIQNANEKSDRIIQEARLKAEKDIETKRHEMQQEMAVLVAQAAYKIAASKENSENDHELYNLFLGIGDTQDPAQDSDTDRK